MKRTVWILCSTTGEILAFHKPVSLFLDQLQHLWYGNRSLWTLLRTSAKIADRLEMYSSYKWHMIHRKLQNISNLHVIYSWRNPDDYEIVTPGISILAQPSVAVVDENVKKHDNAEAAKAYLKYLYSDEAQELIAENYYRPIDQTILKKHADTFDLKVKLTTIKDFGGWDAVQKKHFADGGVFDEIYEE